MKSLKRNLLALAIIGAPFAAQAELKPIDDAQMGSITGQAGVTIELETKVNIGEFRYTDEGSLAIKDISIGGAGAGYEDEKTETDSARHRGYRLVHYAYLAPCLRRLAPRLGEPEVHCYRLSSASRARAPLRMLVMP